jgi:hypothetical protein
MVNGIAFSADQVPCSVGRLATRPRLGHAQQIKRFQRRYDLSDDGSVGPNTWSKADTNLSLDHKTVGYEYIKYKSLHHLHAAGFERHQSTGNYWVPAGAVSAPAWNTSRSLPRGQDSW